MNKYEVRTQKKKAAIVQAALRLFREKGFNQVSIKDIAVESGVSSVSLYNYFGSKEGVAKECANVMMGEIVQATRELMSQNIEFKDKLLKALDMCTDQDYQLLCSPGASEDPVLSGLYSESANEIRVQIIGEFIELGKQEGAIHDSVSTETVLELLNAIGMVQVEWARTGEYKAKMDELNRFFLFGLIGRP